MSRSAFRPLFGVIVKEWLDATRDRRSLASAFVYALAAPLAIGLALTMLARRDADVDRLTIAVEGAALAPSLIAALGEYAEIEHTTRPDLAIGDRRASLALVIDDGFPGDIQAGRSAVVRVFYDQSRAQSRASMQRVSRILNAHARMITDARLVARGIAPRLVRPLDVQQIDVSTARSRTAPALATLPIFLVVAVFVGSMNLAIDATAGERERRSIEALLVAPARPSVVVVGKWCIAVLLSAAGAALTLLCTRLVLHSAPVRSLDVPVGLSWTAAASIMMVLLPLALFAPAIQMLIATCCRSYKEGQTYLSLLLFVPMVPGFLVAFEAFPIRAWMAWVPMLSQHLSIAALLRDDAFNPGPLAAATVASLVITAIALRIISRLLERENIVFGL